jgi:hypothetical protein
MSTNDAVLVETGCHFLYIDILCHSVKFYQRLAGPDCPHLLSLAFKKVVSCMIMVKLVGCQVFTLLKIIIMNINNFAQIIKTFLILSSQMPLIVLNQIGETE